MLDYWNDEIMGFALRLAGPTVRRGKWGSGLLAYARQNVRLHKLRLI
jgi:hypothetical protein